MLVEYLLIILLQLIVSYYLFKLYSTSSINLLKFDEFSFFERGKINSGAGIIFFCVFIIFFLVYWLWSDTNFYVPDKLFIFFIALTIFSIVGFVDDIKNLDPKLRLIIQIVCVYFSLSTVPHIVTFLPIKLSLFISLFFWIYIININNFVDGADGFCTTISIFFFLSVLFLCIYYDLNIFSKFISILILPILIMFILFNNPPAKLFMGDAGSIFLGFLIGYCIIELSFNNFYYFALAAYAYPIVDCSIALCKKMLKGHLPWKRMGDYYFLLPKKRKKNCNFLIVERKIYLSIFSLSIVNMTCTVLSAYLNLQYLALLNFLFAFCLVLIFRRFKI
jgi:UDP-N-acetylmuramyl pentapeptide phosphotransferase/UDP-N-acetylglucosamine-1-phosphate transferase